MSFYVTLPSNSSLDFFPSNSLSEYTTLLKVPIKFDVPYEVGLAEITYSNIWTCNLGTFRFEGNETNNSNTILTNESCLSNTALPNVIFPIKHRDGDTYRTLINNINNTLHGIIYYNDKMCLNNHDEFQKFLDAKREKKLLPELHIVDHRIEFNLPNNTYLILEKNFTDIFGLPKSIIEDGQVSIHLENLDKELRLVNSLYVYSDTIKYQYVGDTLAPLLRNVQVPNSGSTATTITYDMPHYIPLNNLSINAINISIKDELGSNILFMLGTQKTIVKLHFRPIRYGF